MAEIDKGYADFHAKWKARLKLKDEHIAKAYMRREAQDVEGYSRLPEDPSKAAIFIRVDGRGVDAQVDPQGLGTMAAEWQITLNESCDGDQRKFTKDYIAQTVALGKHLEEGGELILFGAVWLIAGTPGALEALAERGAALLVEFTYDSETRTRRLRKSILGPAAANQ